MFTDYKITNALYFPCLSNVSGKRGGDFKGINDLLVVVLHLQHFK